ncbi:Golgi phosphoprotein 3 GPP34 [Pseudonocardia sediminis]|uniref:Golgi phosphoprotein 3 GPP34 n=1 Tax=Pseudonocardia sediminis TaxID=1397368 RepID=A0A4Q7V172_PSEST|nr:GPP34 family phosphoprotein [Pseudonocardia sediminis]RZT87865.1 Golgi phosphoprotein 3 GPP34 [Pseudonocardia sediminis]
MGADLLISEELLLLGLDDESGKPTWTFDSTILNGAVLFDLVRSGSVEIVDKKVLVTDFFPEHPLLRRVQEVIADEKKTRSVSHWQQMLPYQVKNLQQVIASRLVADGVLTEESGKVMGLFKQTKLPEADPGPERALRARLHDILVVGREPSEHDALLITLLEAGYQTGYLLTDVEKEQRKAGKKRAAAIAKDFKENPVVKAGSDAQMAMFTTIFAAGMISSGSGN